MLSSVACVSVQLPLCAAPAGVAPLNDGQWRTRRRAPTDALEHNLHCLGRTMAEKSLSRIFRGVTFANALFKEMSWWVSASASAKKLHQSTHHPGSLKAEFILYTAKLFCKARFSVVI
jgi:hypothetical protein